MATSQSERPDNIKLTSVQYPAFPTDRGMARVGFDTDLIDSRNDTIEVVVEIRYEGQPIQNVVKAACQTLAQEFRQFADQLDEFAKNA